MKHSSDLLTRAVSEVTPRKLAEEKLTSGMPMRIYLGIDPTGSKLHLGHSVPLRKLRAFQDAGHHVIFLIGSFTAMIGDPSGRDTQREPLTKQQVMTNFEKYREQAAKVLDFEKLDVVYNHEWLEKLSPEEMLKLASHFTVQQMEKREMFAKRIEQDSPISIHEFLYPLLVGYDSVMLDVDCELGGNDQLFNMLCGRTLQKAYGKRDKFVLTTKLIEGTDGRKMSKTYDNCIWIDDSAKDMFGKTMSIKDELIVPYMECLTDIPMDEIRETEKKMEKGSNPKESKMQLARAIVALYHGDAAAAHAEEEFNNVFKDKGVPEEMPEINVEEGSTLIDVIVSHKLASSKSDARRLVEQGGVTLNDRMITEINAKVEEGIVKVGKRKFAKLHY